MKVKVHADSQKDQREFNMQELYNLQDFSNSSWEDEAKYMYKQEWWALSCLKPFLVSIL